MIRTENTMKKRLRTHLFCGDMLCTDNQIEVEFLCFQLVFHVLFYESLETIHAPFPCLPIIRSYHACDKPLLLFNISFSEEQEQFSFITLFLLLNYKSFFLEDRIMQPLVWHQRFESSESRHSYYHDKDYINYLCKIKRLL